jgi:hypothetical protein
MKRATTAFVWVLFHAGSLLWGQAVAQGGPAKSSVSAKKNTAARKIEGCEIKAARDKVPAGGKVRFKALHAKPKGTKFTYGWSTSAGQLIGGQGTPSVILDTTGISPGYATLTVEIGADTDAPFGPERRKVCSNTISILALEIVEPEKVRPKRKGQAAKQNQ